MKVNLSLKGQAEIMGHAAGEKSDVLFLTKRGGVRDPNCSKWVQGKELGSRRVSDQGDCLFTTRGLGPAAYRDLGGHSLKCEELTGGGV